MTTDLQALIQHLRGGDWNLRAPQEMADMIADELEAALAAAPSTSPAAAAVAGEPVASQLADKLQALCDVVHEGRLVPDSDASLGYVHSAVEAAEAALTAYRMAHNAGPELVAVLASIVECHEVESGWVSDAHINAARIAISRATKAAPHPSPSAAELPDPTEMAAALLSVERGSRCPLCGWGRPHQHSPREITIYRNGVKFGRLSTEPWTGADDQGLADEAGADTGSACREVQADTHQHHQHRERQPDSDGDDAHGDSTGPGVRGGCDVQEQVNPRAVDTALTDAPSASPAEAPAKPAEAVSEYAWMEEAAQQAAGIVPPPCELKITTLPAPTLLGDDWLNEAWSIAGDLWEQNRETGKHLLFAAILTEKLSGEFSCAKRAADPENEGATCRTHCGDYTRCIAAHPQPVAPAGQAAAGAQGAVARLLALASEEHNDAAASVQHGADQADVPEWARLVVRVLGQPSKPAAYWIPKAEQFCVAPKDGSRPFAKAWEPLYPGPAVERGVAEERERERFEAWRLRFPMDVDEGCTIGPVERDDDGEYFDEFTDSAWIGWKAGVGLSTAGKEQA